MFVLSINPALNILLVAVRKSSDQKGCWQTESALSSAIMLMLRWSLFWAMLLGQMGGNVLAAWGGVSFAASHCSPPTHEGNEVDNNCESPQPSIMKHVMLLLLWSWHVYVAVVNCLGARSKIIPPCETRCVIPKVVITISHQCHNCTGVISCCTHVVVCSRKAKHWYWLNLPLGTQEVWKTMSVLWNVLDISLELQLHTK